MPRGCNKAYDIFALKETRPRKDALLHDRRAERSQRQHRAARGDLANDDLATVALPSNIAVRNNARHLWDRAPYCPRRSN